jgi:hypothetical protein
MAAYHSVPINSVPYANRAPSTTYGQATSQARGRPVPSPLHFQQGAANGDDALANLANTFSQTHLSVPATTMPGSNGGMPSPVFYTADGHMVFAPGAGLYSAQSLAPQQYQDGAYGGFTGGMQYLTPAAYSPYMSGYSMLPYTPGRGAGYASDRSDVPQKGVPGLDNRRGSYSTDNESAPGTPYYPGMGLRDSGAHIQVLDRSPIYSTPSPQLSTHHLGQNLVKPLPFNGLTTVDLDALVKMHPPIPRAVPAVFTPPQSIRTLEQSLSNPIPGNRNVYIRGLHPDTDDETLAAYAARFGKIETSKAIIDTATGACKGFGFAKYFEAHDSELCIRGFHKLGYEVGFARESFNSRLKAEGDETSTNLYVSNLPKDMTETELASVFSNYNVVSSRILRDAQGQSRGVGFARFESRDICEEIIKKFNGQPLGGEGTLLQVRYADTAAQKELKKITSERRQFRTQEYNVGAYGEPAAILALQPGIPSPALRVAQIVRHLPQSKISGPWKRDSTGFFVEPSAATLEVPVINKSPVKVPQPRIVASEAKELREMTTTPVVSEEGSEDEGVTVHVLSPLTNRGVTFLSPKDMTV